MAFLVLLMICYFFKSSPFGLLIPLRRDMRNLIVQGTHLQPPSLSFLLPVQQFLLSILLAAAELLPILVNKFNIKFPLTGWLHDIGLPEMEVTCQPSS